MATVAVTMIVPMLTMGVAVSISSAGIVLMPGVTAALFPTIFRTHYATSQ